MDEFIGWIGGTVVVGGIFGVVFLVIRADDPCTVRNTAWRAELIESHERCMVEENCIYEDRDIRRYDLRVAQQEACKIED